MEDPGNVIVTFGTVPAIGRCISARLPGSSYRWIYLGKDVSYSLELECVLGAGFRIPIGDLLQETAEKNRQLYIDYIGTLSQHADREHQLGCWWLSSVSEKNPFISDFFLYFCYIRLIQDILGSHQGNILVVCESPALGRAVYSNLPAGSRNIFMTDPGFLSEALRSVMLSAHSIARKGWFLAVFASRRILARFYQIRGKGSFQGNIKQTGICIHAITDLRSLTDPAHYRHIYFRKLGPDLEKSGRDFFYLIDILPTVSYRAVVNRLRQYPEHYCLLEEFITVPDLFRALLRVRNERVLPPDLPRMDGVAMEHIFRKERECDAVSSRREEAFLRYCAAKRLAAAGSLKNFIYTFENHIWEKMFCRALGNYSPHTVRTGYAHSIVNSMYTCYSLSAAERDLLPLPDIIAVNGSMAKDVLESSGFKGRVIDIVGALRYSHLRKRPFAMRGREDKTVLVALSAGVNDSLELVRKAVSALGGMDRIRVIIKCHPTVPFSFISDAIGTLPRNVRFEDRPVEVLLETADVLLYSESAVCVEAIAMGVPPVHVRSDYRIDMNILGCVKEVPTVSTLEEIRKTIDRVTVPDAVQSWSAVQGIVDEIFAPVREDYVETLIGSARSVNP